jgi:hypothetical protein
MKEIEGDGRLFTWSNNQEDPTLCRLDRIFTSVQVESPYPLMYVRTLPRVISDHSPILIDFGLQQVKVDRLFRFELCWFLRDDLREVIEKVWSKNYIGRSFLDRWQNRNRRLRQMLKGWNLNYVWFYKKQKNVLVEAIDKIDKDSEVNGLSLDNYVLRKHFDEDLHRIYKEEEVDWFQRAKEKELLEGDACTSYFMDRASGRRRINRISILNQEEGMVQGDANILSYATAFYKNLFGPCSSIADFHMEGVIQNVLTKVDTETLDRMFSLEEIKMAVFQMKHNKVSSPDGLPVEFYQKFWDLVCDHLLFLFHEFFLGRLDILRLNYGVLTLLPKKIGADTIKQYRPICLFNVLFKIFTKVLNNRDIVVADKSSITCTDCFY